MVFGILLGENMKIADVFYDYMGEKLVVHYEGCIVKEIDYSPEGDDIDETVKGLINGTIKPWW